MPRLHGFRLLSLLLAASTLQAQGVTSAAIQGRIVEPDGRPVAGAIVAIVSIPNGRQWRVSTTSSGGFALENVPVGGPYSIEARALGFAPVRLAIPALALGQRFVADLVLQPAAFQLEPVTVAATADPLISSGYIGPAQLISDSTVARLPNLAHSLANLALLSPYVSLRFGGAMSIGAQNPVLNRFQIDGGENGEAYLGREPGSGIPSAAVPQVLPRTISMEAVQEFQVLVAPFDVRQGGFAGGLVNVVTRSGTNTSHGSVFTFFENQSLAAGPTARASAENFAIWQFGGWVAGPVVRDRLQYFASADLQQRGVPDPGPLIADTAGGADLGRIGIRYASAVRFDSILRRTYGLDPGSLGPSEGRIPTADLFGKLTVQLSTNSQVELSHHYAHGSRRGFVPRERGMYRLSSVAEEDLSTQSSSRLLWTSLLAGRHANELQVSYLSLRDPCRPNADFPRIRVTADGGFLFAGPNMVCPTNNVSQEVLELTDNLTMTVGAHLITLGTHNELLHFRDPLLLESAGTWVFSSLDKLDSAEASSYEIGLPGPDRRVVDFHVRQLDLYTQDRWTPAPRLTLTLGLRLDVPVLPDAARTNSTLRASLGINTAQLPSGTPLWSPRLAAAYDLRGDGSMLVRGGIGLFSGSPPYRYLGNAYRYDGLEETELRCDSPDVPPFTPMSQPTSCPTSGRQPVPRISFFDPGLKFPQSLRLSVGLDRRLPSGIVGTVELLYTRAVHDWYFTDANLRHPLGTASGEGGRPLYGWIDSIGHPTYADSLYGPIIRVSNRRGGRAVSFSLQLQRQFHNGIAFNAAYAYSRAEDLMSLVNYAAVPQVTGTPLDGTLEDRQLRRSAFDIPHRVSVSVSANLPYHTQLALIYAGSSGTPFTYVINGDANADGMGGPTSVLRNDIVYVPRDSGDITLAGGQSWAALDAFVNAQPCLRSQRGRIMTRNSCRNGWLGYFNLRLAKTVSPSAGHRGAEFAADIFNILNLLSSRWGRYRATATTDVPSVMMLQLVGHDAVKGRGVYRLILPARNQVLDAASRWQVQLGARYMF
jgi:carboxypeptidase family protein